MYGRANGNESGARRVYPEHFPRRRIPERRTFPSIDRRLKQFGTRNVRINDRIEKRLSFGRNNF